MMFSGVPQIPAGITGHSYIVYGPLSNGVTSIIVEGAPDYPDPGAWWGLCEKYKVTAFYTAPTAVRLFMKYGNEWPDKYDLSSLRILGSVGEPINPEAWEWYYEHIGGKNAAIVDTWWQTETGGHMIVSLPACKQKPGKAGRPFFGIEADVVDKQGNPVKPNTVGFLVVKAPHPSSLRTCYGEPERFNNYWNEMEGFYYAGDFATKDEDGFIMILGRADDVLNVSGHRIGTAEVESALVSHAAIAEAAVIGKPHPVKGESIKAFVIAMSGVEPDEALLKENQAPRPQGSRCTGRPGWHRFRCQTAENALWQDHAPRPESPGNGYGCRRHLDFGRLSTQIHANAMVHGALCRPLPVGHSVCTAGRLRLYPRRKQCPDALGSQVRTATSSAR